MAQKTYEEYLKTIKPGMLGPDGRFLSPDHGANYAAEGMSPQEFFDFQNQQVEHQSNMGSGGTSTYGARGPADAGWTPGVIDTKRGALGNFGMGLGVLAAPFALSAMGLGAASGGAAAGGGEAAGGFAGLGGAGGAAGAGADFGLAGAGLGAGESAAGFAGIGSGAAGSAGIGSGTALGGAGAGGGGLLSTIGSKVGDFLTDPSSLIKIGGAVAGAAASKDSTTTNSSSKDPWGPAQSYLKDNLATNAAMQEHYRQNPFSDLQKQQYGGLFNNLANNQANSAGLLANASAFGQSNRGVMPPMTGLLSGTQAPPIDWTQYQNIGRK